MGWAGGGGLEDRFVQLQLDSGACWEEGQKEDIPDDFTGSALNIS